MSKKKRKTRPLKKTGRFFVYILKCADNTYYTGYTPDLERRITLHEQGKAAKYTRGRRPLELVWHKEYKYFRTAFLWEKKIQKLTRQRKELLIAKARKKYGGKKTGRERSKRSSITG